MSGQNIRGVVFDADGVLFDTERLGRLSWLEVGQEIGYPQAEQSYLEFIGLNRTDAEAKMLRLFGADFPCDYFMRMCSACTQARIERDGVPLKPGVRELLTCLQKQNIPVALATSSGRKRITRRLDMTGLAPFFSAIVTGEQVVHGKPAPEIYQLACRHLGISPEQALAIEDSPNGILSASRAGMQVVMVPDLVQPSPDLSSLLTACCASLTAVRDWLAGRL